jgi:hypothetical protein
MRCDEIVGRVMTREREMTRVLGHRVWRGGREKVKSYRLREKYKSMSPLQSLLDQKKEEVRFWDLY